MLGKADTLGTRRAPGAAGPTVRPEPPGLSPAHTVPHLFTVSFVRLQNDNGNPVRLLRGVTRTRCNPCASKCQGRLFPGSRRLFPTLRPPLPPRPAQPVTPGDVLALGWALTSCWAPPAGGGRGAGPGRARPGCFFLHLPPARASPGGAAAPAQRPALGCGFHCFH